MKNIYCRYVYIYTLKGLELRVDSKNDLRLDLDLDTTLSYQPTISVLHYTIASSCIVLGLTA